MESLVYTTGLALIVVLLGVWAVVRARRIRQEASERELEALMLVKSGKDPVAAAERDAETALGAAWPAAAPGTAGLEVAEVADVVDIDALLSGESTAVAARARAALEGPTNLHQGMNTLPPVRPRASAPNPRVTATARARAAASPDSPPATAAGIPLRELVLTWFEARGYRGSPASPAVRPIELVLRHKDDPARAYAFVVEKQRVDSTRVERLREQARAVGLQRLLVVADGGAAADATGRHKSVRVVERPVLDQELRKLDLSIAAKIIAVARNRAAARPAA